MKPQETEEYSLLKNWFSGEDCKAIIIGERRRSWSDDSKQLEVMKKWHAADEAGREECRQGWRDGIVARAKKKEAATKQAAADAVAAEKILREMPSAFADITGLELSRLFAGTHPLPEFWEKHWTAEEKDRTRHLLANQGLGLRKVESPSSPSGKSISRYELAPRKKNASEKLMELPPLPSGKQWAKMSDEQREEAVAENKETFRDGGVTASKIKGLSERHLYELVYCSRRDSRMVWADYAANGEIPDGYKLKSSFTEKTGISCNGDFNDLPINVAKALILAHSGGAVARYWEGRSNSSDMAEEMRVWAAEGYKPSRAPFFVNI